MSSSSNPDNLAIDSISAQVSDTEVLYYIQKNPVGWKQISMIKELTGQNDEVIADWLNVSVRTFRDYRKSESNLRENIKEHILLLVSLLKHGNSVFGSPQSLDAWLNTANFYLDNRKPKTFLNTVTGLRLIGDRLTAMEYGDNL